MREILFRGFHPDEKGTEKVFVNGEWIKGEWVNGYYEHWNGNTYIDNSSDDVVNSGGYPIRQHHEVVPETVGEYIGKDKDGNPIFEGDILKLRCNFSGKIVVCAVTFGTRLNANDKCEVIGNIYDNPDVLICGKE